MCKFPVKIKSLSPYNVKESYVPCGHCSECRSSMALSWSLRLRSELDYYCFKHGYNVGFVTLTYEDGHLPFIPEKFFLEGQYKPIPCFSYLDIRKFFNCIRSWFWRDLHLKHAFRFFLSSEYGEQFHRPHYHFIIIYHPSVSAETMYYVCSDAWCGTDYIIPLNQKNFRKKRFFYGIISPFDSFVPRDNYAVGAYVAKYVCKDLSYASVIDENFRHLYKDKKALRELRKCGPSHRQSLSFGKCAFEGLEDGEIVDSFVNGMSFFGDKTTYSLPRYLYGKLLFRLYRFYDIRSHVWHTFKLYTHWFFYHRRLVYDALIKQKLFLYSRLRTKEYWQSHICHDEEFSLTAFQCCSGIIDSLSASGELESLAQFDVLYFGLPPSRCHVSDFPEEIYFARFNPCADLSDLPILDEDYYIYMSQCLRFLKDFVHYERKVVRSAQDEFISQVRAFFQNGG